LLLQVVFVGDTDIVETSRAVLKAIAEWVGEDEGFLVIDADMSYEEPANPVGYSALLDEYLGEKFPVFVTVGTYYYGRLSSCHQFVLTPCLT
jgi:hypothetical protein